MVVRVVAALLLVTGVALVAVQPWLWLAGLWLMETAVLIYVAETTVGIRNIALADTAGFQHPWPPSRKWLLQMAVGVVIGLIVAVTGGYWVITTDSVVPVIVIAFVLEPAAVAWAISATKRNTELR